MTLLCHPLVYLSHSTSPITIPRGVMLRVFLPGNSAERMGTSKAGSTMPQPCVVQPCVVQLQYSYQGPRVPVPGGVATGANTLGLKSLAVPCLMTAPARIPRASSRPVQSPKLVLLGIHRVLCVWGCRTGSNLWWWYTAAVPVVRGCPSNSSICVPGGIWVPSKIRFCSATTVSPLKAWIGTGAPPRGWKYTKNPAAASTGIPLAVLGTG